VSHTGVPYCPQKHTFFLKGSQCESGALYVTSRFDTASTPSQPSLAVHNCASSLSSVAGEITQGCGGAHDERKSMRATPGSSSNGWSSTSSTVTRDRCWDARPPVMAMACGVSAHTVQSTIAAIFLLISSQHITLHRDRSQDRALDDTVCIHGGVEPGTEATKSSDCPRQEGWRGLSVGSTASLRVDA
jgi:hypothetical protein